ncbi:MAG: bifunctional nuclease family protein [Anaerolineaceae bacterium]|nr:MAG: bifunctional nuclease family protein [Anaerolineaceae bacterium]
MIEVVIDSIRVSLMSQHRVVILKDANGDRLLPIWVGSYEADAITSELQDEIPARPMTHDLLKSTIYELGGTVVHVYINELRSDVYYARIVVEMDGRQVEIDSRSSDAIALAVRAKVPIFVAEAVLERAGIRPDEDVQDQIEDDAADDAEAEASGEGKVDDKKLSAFADFVNSLDLDLDDDDDSKN